MDAITEKALSNCILQKVFNKHGVPFAPIAESILPTEDNRTYSRDMTPFLNLITEDLKYLAKELGKEFLFSNQCCIQVECPLFLDCAKIKEHIISYVGPHPLVVCAMTFSTRVYSILCCKYKGHKDNLFTIDPSTGKFKSVDLMQFQWWKDNFGCDISEMECSEKGLGKQSLGAYLVEKANKK